MKQNVTELYGKLQKAKEIIPELTTDKQFSLMSKTIRRIKKKLKRKLGKRNVATGHYKMKWLPRLRNWNGEMQVASYVRKVVPVEAHEVYNRDLLKKAIRKQLDIAGIKYNPKKNTQKLGNLLLAHGGA